MTKIYEVIDRGNNEYSHGFYEKESDAIKACKKGEDIMIKDAVSNTMFLYKGHELTKPTVKEMLNNVVAEYISLQMIVREHILK